MQPKIKHLPIIINPASGRPEPILSIINAAFKDSDIVWDVLIVKKIGDAVKFAKDLAAAKEKMIAVYGGDGTVMETITGLDGANIPLAILPGGTANVMAVELGIPWDLKEGCEMIRDGKYELRAIDIAHLGKREFMLRACVGFEADMVIGAKRETKHRFGRLAYVLSAMSAVQKIKLNGYDITVDGVTHKVKGLTCIIANSGNAGFGDLTLAQPINVSDGMLDVLVIKKFDFSLVRYIWRVLTKAHPEDDRELVGHWQGKQIKVECHPPQVVVCDGEVLKREKSMEAVIACNHVKIVAPREKKKN